MPIQVTHTDINSPPQKLSKIETIRLARNYIIAMTQTLQEDKPMEIMRFIKLLSSELSQTTANLLSGTLLNNRNSSFSYRQYCLNEYQNYCENQDLSKYNHSHNQRYLYDENYGQLWDHYGRSNSSRNIHGLKYWEYNNNNNGIFNNPCAYGNYPYAGQWN